MKGLREKMTYVGAPTTPIGSMIAGIAAVVTAVVEIVRHIADSFKMKKAENKMIGTNPIDLQYNPMTKRYQYNNVSDNMRFERINTNNGGMNNMSEFKYDVYQSMRDPDMPATSNIRRYMPHDFGYDTNKTDYVWTNKKLGEVPSTSEYTPYSQRRMFDPIHYLNNASSYVNGVYYPYSNQDMSAGYEFPKFNDEYTKDPQAGIIYKNLENRMPRRVYNPYEPTRPFATYDPRTIDARNPDHNPFGWSQDFINGMVNRTNYYKDYLLNISPENPFGAPNELDNPYKTMPGPSYVGPDGKMYTHPMPPEPKEHVTRNFLRRDVPWITKGPEWFGWNPYGISCTVFNPDGTPTYYNNPNGGAIIMSQTRRNQIGPNDFQSNLGDNPYVANYWRKQEAAQQSYVNPMINNMAYEAVNNKCYTVQHDPTKIDPMTVPNPRAASIQDRIDRSRVYINPASGYDINNESPNATLDSLMNLTPQQAMAVVNGAPMPQYQQSGYPQYQNTPMYQQTSYPQYSQYPQYSYTPNNNASYGYGESCLGPNVYAGVPTNEMVARQRANYQYYQPQYNGYDESYGRPQYQYQSQYQNTPMYQQTSYPQYSYNNNHPSMFVDDHYTKPVYDESYGRPEPQPQQRPDYQYYQNPPYDDYRATHKTNPTVSDIMGTAAPSSNTVFTQSFGPNDKAVAAAADADCANMNEVMNNVFAQLSAAGDNASVDDIQFNTPEHQMTTRETNKAVFGIDFGSDE